jgi:hypothetical protein
MRSNWKKFAGTLNANGTCAATAKKDSFCDALIDIKKFMKANFDNYHDKLKCTATPIDLTDDVLIAHVYGWTPFNDGCAADANLLHLTPGYAANESAEYLRVKVLFDKLNYDKLPDGKYDFNPWAKLIHGDHYVNAPNVYAYSVDDAVGNIQAEGGGFIIDIGSTKDLENDRPAEPPINVTFGYSPNDPIRFTNYRVCSNDPSRDRQVNSLFPAFVVNASDPDKCPVYLYDNKSPQQLYTFRITRDSKTFTYLPDPPRKWDANTTAKPIDCKGNTGTAL